MISVSLLHHLVTHTAFDFYVDHMSVTQIPESKVMPASQIIGIFLELLSNYSSNLHFVKSKDLILSDFIG